MEFQIIIKDDVPRGIVTSMLLAVVGGFFVIIIQSVREGITVWLFKHFPNNRGKLYVMATSRAGSYLDVLGLFNLLGGFPMFAVLLLMTIGMLGQAFSGLVVGTKNIRTDLCTSTECFSTGFGQNPLNGSDIAIPTAAIDLFSSMNNFVLQSLNDTITSGLPWAPGYMRRISAANFPRQIREVPFERLTRRVEFTGIYDSTQIYGSGVIVDYANGTTFKMTIAVTQEIPYEERYNGWFIGDDVGNVTFDGYTQNVTDSIGVLKAYQLSTNTTAGIALLLGTSIEQNFGNLQFSEEAINRVVTGNYTGIKRVTFFGAFIYQSWLGILDLTFQARGAGPDYRLHFSTASNIRHVRFVDSGPLFSAVLDNLESNLGVLRNHSQALQTAYLRQSAISSVFESGDLLSYVSTCFAMAVSQTRPIGMIRGYEHAEIITPAITIKLVIAIPLLLVTIAFLIPYAIVTVKLYTNSDKWLSYKLHADAREYIINLCHSTFLVDKVRDDDEVLKIIREDHGDDGLIFEIEEKSAQTATHFL
ncbi:hypothetical protein BGZ96_010612 [Linnemannia gamsii]|uniref:Uncharacterized protein n=1 Tax=Linnemannia gamsii TaxID=64522 RepID=A0ABQ7KCQ5_9FUNG|nr:hypothetical protein BGZ96_010612 [Linnemannia gamsii]